MMKRVLRWIGLGVAAVASVVVFVALGVFAASEVMVRWPQPKAEATVEPVAARDAGALMRGKRIATVYGCHDCHGADLTGRLFFDEMPVGRLSGPNLSTAIAHQSDADIAHAIRAGVAADGRSLWIMPSDAFARLSDGETADLIAYLRTFPAKAGPPQIKEFGPVGRIGVLLGKFQSAPQLLKAKADVQPVDLGPQYAQGRALARACMECHGPDLKGREEAKAPDLTIAGAYDAQDFERLLRTGVAAGGRKLGLMTEAAPGRFNALSHEEIGALHSYLKARAERPS
jgi:mono/diheme cytochrome c family protein